MDSKYYLLKNPDSVPLYDEENKTYTLYFDGEEVVLSEDVFNKMFMKMPPEIENLISVIKTMKQFGMSKDEVMRYLDDFEGVNEETKTNTKYLIEHVYRSK